jgi:hypothetical protein
MMLNGYELRKSPIKQSKFKESNTTSKRPYKLDKIVMVASQSIPILSRPRKSRQLKELPGAPYLDNRKMSSVLPMSGKELRKISRQK